MFVLNFSNVITAERPFVLRLPRLSGQCRMGGKAKSRCKPSQQFNAQLTQYNDIRKLQGKFLTLVISR